jgi:osmotically-inducible protein OsmY
VDVENYIDVLDDSSSEESETKDSDQASTRRLEYELYATDAFDTDRIEITANEDTITLRGVVRSRAEKLLAERIARGVEAEKQVVNELKVARPETDGDRLQ